MEENRFRTPLPEDRRIGCSIFGWLAFLAALAVILFLGYRTKVYYDHLRAGDIIDLPQFTSRFTAPAGSKMAISAAADRTKVEADGEPSLGLDEGAKLTIVEFADFECPYSKEEAPIVRTLMAKYGDRVRFVYRDLPLDSIHVNARQAASAAECAREQEKFWAYHDKLYLNAPALGFKDLMRYAEETGLDVKQFERCLTEDRYRDAIAKDAAAAASVGVTGTPTFFLNGQRIEGAIPADALEGLVEKMIR